MTRAPYVRLTPDGLDDEQRELHDAIAGGPRAAAAGIVPVVAPDGALEGPFGALLYAADLGAAVQRVGARVRYGSVLSDRERELATVFVAGRLGSGYELWAHRRLGAAAGLAADELETAATGMPPAGLAPREADLLALAGALLDGTEPPETSLGERVEVELTVLVGYYRLLDGVLRVAGVATPPDRD